MTEAWVGCVCICGVFSIDQNGVVVDLHEVSQTHKQTHFLDLFLPQSLSSLLACSVALKLVAYQIGGGRGCAHYYDV